MNNLEQIKTCKVVGIFKSGYHRTMSLLPPFNNDPKVNNILRCEF